MAPIRPGVAVFDHVSLYDFRCLRAVTLELSRLTVLVGPNGCGKSSVLQGIHMLSRASTSPDAPTVCGRIAWSPAGREVSTSYLRLDANVMRRSMAAEGDEPSVAEDGAGLASALRWMGRRKPAASRRIAVDLARIVPGVRRIIGDRFSIELENGVEISALVLGDGMLLILGLVTKLQEPELPRVLLIDDIDRGLHIEVQARLVDVLRDSMRRNPELQIICTTHSPYLVDRLDPSEVRVLDLDATRATHAKPLTAHPELDKWRFGTQTGELWAALGEAWVTSSGL